MSELAAGDLRHRVTLLRNNPTSMPSGQQVVNFEQVGTYYALVEGIRAFEMVNANQYSGFNCYRITMRASAGPIYPSDCLQWNGRTLNVVGAVIDPFNVKIEIDATEKPAQ